MRRRLLLAFALLGAVLAFVLVIKDEMRDFEVNYTAGTRLRAGESLYQTSDGHYMFKYFPSSALLYVPLSLLPMPAAKTLWYALTLLSSVALFVLSKRLAWEERPGPWYLLAIPPFALAKFFVVEIKLGQINALVTLVLLFTLRQRTDARAGALWGLATAMKPYGLILLPYYVVLRRVRALAAGLAVLAGAFLLPAVFYGLEGNLELHREWYRTLSASTPRELASADNVSLAAFITKWDLAPAVGFGVVLALALLMLAILRWRKGLPRPQLLELAILLVMIPLVSPLGWDYQFLTSVLGVTVLARHWTDFPVWARALLAANLTVIGLSVYDLIGRAAYGRFMAWSVLTLSFVVVVSYLAFLRYRALD